MIYTHVSGGRPTRPTDDDDPRVNGDRKRTPFPRRSGSVELTRFEGRVGCGGQATAGRAVAVAS